MLTVLVAMAFVLQAGAAPAPTGDEEQLRKQALGLNSLTGEEAIKGALRELLEKPNETKKLLAVAVRMAKEKPQPLKPNATLVLANAARGLKQYDAAEVLYRVNAEQALKLQSGKGLSEAYSGLIIVLYANKKFSEAEQVCREFLEIDGDESIDLKKPAVLERMILAMGKQGKTKEAIEILDRLVKKQPDNWLTLELKGRMLHEAGQLDEALKVYEAVTEQIKNDKRLKDKKEIQDDFLDDVRYALSGLYIDRNEVDKAAEQLKALLAREPNNPTFNNDLGYIWADHDMNLAESEKLIRKALEEDRRLRQKANPDLKPEDDKDNAAYLDSLGWVLYKQKKYAEAKPLFQKAVEDEEGQHLEIFDHLGDVHNALGEKDQAVAAWKKGLKLAGNSKRDQQRKAAVEKKLKESK
jgi:tetratricopeptide (TPR) repeat protein